MWLRFLTETQIDILRQQGFRRREGQIFKQQSLAFGTNCKVAIRLVVLRGTVGAFRESEVALAQTFADQAVIAIQNVRLFREAQEARAAAEAANEAC